MHASCFSIASDVGQHLRFLQQQCCFVGGVHCNSVLIKIANFASCQAFETCVVGLHACLQKPAHGLSGIYTGESDLISALNGRSSRDTAIRANPVSNKIILPHIEPTSFLPDLNV